MHLQAPRRAGRLTAPVPGARRGSEDEMSNECVICGKAFTRFAKPRWVFERDGDGLRTVGLAHATHALQAHNRDPQLFAPAGVSDENEAGFTVWRWYVLPQPEYATALFYAHILAQAPTTERTERQQELLHHWVHGPLKMSQEKADEAERIHDQLVAEYRAMSERAS